MIRKILLASVVLLVCLGAAESYFVDRPLRRIQQVLKSDNSSLRFVGDVPVWQAQISERTQVANRSCLSSTNGEVDVMLLGDSIFFGVMVDPSLTLAPLLQRQLSERLGRPSCVINLSEPGFSFQSQAAMFREEVAQNKPKIVVLELWFNSTHKFIPINGAVYNFGNLEKDENGLPNLGLPSALNRVLFSNSALWRHVSVGLAPTTSERLSDRWADFVITDLEPFAAWLDAQNIELVVAFATTLGTPFSDGRPTQNTTYRSAMEWAAARGVPQVVFSDVLANEDVASVRNDTCCHLNARGTKLVADDMAPKLLQLLDSAEE